MADRVRRVNYAYVKVPNRPGQGARIPISSDRPR
jgi:hypothetical protein